MASDPNLARLEETAERLGPLLDELMLVGGCATGLLVTDPGAAPIRPTVDVDVVVEAASYGTFTAFEEWLRPPLSNVGTIAPHGTRPLPRHAP